MAAKKHINTPPNSSDVVFNIRVFLLNPDRSIKEKRDIEINADDEAAAFNNLPKMVKDIHNGDWYYAGYFQTKKK